MSVKNRIWKAKDYEESARTTLLLLQFRIHRNIYVCWIINSGRVVHVSVKVVPSTSATMDLVIRSENPSGHVTNYNTKDPGRRPWKFPARFRRHPVAFSFQILDNCLWSSTAYAIEIIISEPWLRFVPVAYLQTCGPNCKDHRAAWLVYWLCICASWTPSIKFHLRLPEESWQRGSV